MYICACIFKRKKKDGWEHGLYVGQGENTKESIIVDRNMQTVDEVWDYKDRISEFCVNVPQMVIGSEPKF